MEGVNTMNVVKISKDRGPANVAISDQAAGAVVVPEASAPATDGSVIHIKSRIRALLLRLLPPLLGSALFILLWAVVAREAGDLPGPRQTWDSAIGVFSHRFHRKGPNDQGIG